MENQPNPAPSIEDSLNAVLSSLTIDLLDCKEDEKLTIQKRIEEIQSILDLRHW
jgi:hypothetical protein